MKQILLLSCMTFLLSVGPVYAYSPVETYDGSISNEEEPDDVATSRDDDDGYGAGDHVGNSEEDDGSTVASESGSTGTSVSGTGLKTTGSIGLKLPQEVSTSTSSSTSGTGLRVTSADAKMWTAKIQENLTASMGKAAQSPGAMPGAGGSSLLAGLGLPTGQIDKALSIAGKLGIDTSGVKEGLAMVDKAGDMSGSISGITDKAQTVMSGTSDQVSSIDDDGSGTTSDTGNLEIGSTKDEESAVAQKENSDPELAGSVGTTSTGDPVHDLPTQAVLTQDTTATDGTNGGKIPGT